ncbi:LytR/AlgR family response regulator transcription factor [candidate division KSB1 bacterium]
MKIKCIIVDDEPIAHDVLEEHISAVESLELVGKFYDPVEAVNYLSNQSVELIFLDIKMPKLSGIEFLDTMINPPMIIITSAYSEFALEGFEHSVLDYLLKPISFSRFLKAVNKAVGKPDKSFQDSAVDHAAADFIYLKSDKIIHRIKLADITYIESWGNYIKVYYNKQMLLVTDTMNNIEKALPNEKFVRTHRSFIVSIDKIEQLEGNLIRIGRDEIPIGKHYKLMFEKTIKKYDAGSSIK